MLVFHLLSLHSLPEQEGFVRHSLPPPLPLLSARLGLGMGGKNSNCHYFLTTYYVPGRMLCILQAVSHDITQQPCSIFFTSNLQSKT